VIGHILSTCFRTPSHRSYIHKIYIVLAIGILLFLSGCASTELQKVKKSASILQLKTGCEIERYVQDLDPEWMPVVSKSRPEVSIGYEPINGHTTKEVFDEIIAILIKNNWKEDEGTKLPGYFSATLQE
jgi:hypothetical protein